MLCSRSSIASTYCGPTAPVSTSTAPQRRIASSRDPARSPGRTASRASNSPTEFTAALDGVDDLGDRGVADEHLERNDHLVGRADPGAGGEALVAQHHVGVGRDRVHRGVLDDHRVLRELPLELAGEHHAAAHARVARDDDLLDVGTTDGGHVPHASWRVSLALAFSASSGLTTVSSSGPSASSAGSPRPKPMSSEATANVTAAEMRMPSRTTKYPPLGV